MIKRLTIATLLVFGILISGLESFGQNSPQLEVSRLINFPDTAYEGTVYDSIFVVVKPVNPTGAAYVGNIGVGYMTDSVQFPRFLYLDTLPNVLTAQDSIMFRVDGFIFDPAVFREGGNVVVVWPITPGIPDDSLYVDVYFIRSMNIGMNDALSADVTIFPNPVNGQLNVNIDGNYRAEYVRIFNQQGAVMISRDYTEQAIDVSAFPAGIYFFELRFRDAIPSRQTFLKAAR